MNDKHFVPVIGVFEHRGKAEGAIDELWHAGFSKEQIGIASPGENLHQATTQTEDLEEKAANGAAAGAVTGAAAGAVVGAAALSIIPGIGPVLGGGLLLGLTTGAAAGAALGTFAGPFVAMGVAEEATQNYAEDLRAGRTLVVVRTDKPEAALSILRSHGPLYVELGGRRLEPRTDAAQTAV